MNGPRRYLTRMLIFLAAVGILIAFLSPQLYGAFSANPGLNGLIIGVLLLGIVYSFRQVTVLTREVAWLDTYRTGRAEISTQSTPRMLAPMAAMLG